MPVVMVLGPSEPSLQVGAGESIEVVDRETSGSGSHGVVVEFVSVGVEVPVAVVVVDAAVDAVRGVFLRADRRFGFGLSPLTGDDGVGTFESTDIVVDESVGECRFR